MRERPPILFRGDDVLAKRQAQAEVGMAGRNDPDVTVRVTIEEVNPRRSLTQNQGWWGYYVTPLAEFMFEQDEDLLSFEQAKQEAHRLLVKECLGTVRVTNPRTGEVTEEPKPTHKLSRDEFDRMKDLAAVWLARYTGIAVVPSPNAAPEPAGRRR